MHGSIPAPDPFFSDNPAYEHYRVEHPAEGVHLDDFFGFQKPTSWRRTPAPAPFGVRRTRSYLGVAITRRRLLAAAGVAGLLLGGLMIRATSLQVVSASRYRSLAEGNRVRNLPIMAERGNITDRTGKVLVDNEPVMSLAVIPAELGTTAQARRAALAGIALLVGDLERELTEYLVAVRGGDATTVHGVKAGLTQEDVVRLTVALRDRPGLVIRADAARRIASDARSPGFGHLIGYVGRIGEEQYHTRRAAGYRRTDVIGKAGAEAAFEPYLRGRPGTRLLEVDARGRAVSVLAEEKTEPGDSLTLSIDGEANRMLGDILGRHLRAHGGRAGAAVAVNPENGEVLALVSLPGFDPHRFARGISAADYAALTADPSRPLFPRATAGLYPSGSTIKPLIAAVALDAGVITPQTTILSSGGITYAGRWFFPDWKAGGHGSTDVVKALAESVNTFFYTIGGGTSTFDGLGPERIASGLQKFGLGKPTGIQHPSEATGLVPTPTWKKQVKGEPWFIGDTYHLSIGQGYVLVTPLQMAVATAAVANGGTVYRPTLIKGDRPAPLETRAASARSLEVVRRGMRAAVTGGSARALADLPVAAAGKTGTAEWKEGARPHAWFTGYAPADRPEIVITVLLEAAGEGSSAAVPVAREFLNWYFSR